MKRDIQQTLPEAQLVELGPHQDTTTSDRLQGNRVTLGTAGRNWVAMLENWVCQIRNVQRPILDKTPFMIMV